MLAEDHIQGRLRYCVIYRYENKRIVKSHIMLTEIMLEMMKQMRGTDHDFKTIYLKPLESESVDSREYWVRRLINCEYICEYK